MNETIARYLAEACDWKFAGDYVDTAGDRITAWRHPTLPQPDPLTVVNEYLAFLEADRPRREAISQADATAREMDVRLEALGLSPKGAVYLVMRDLCDALPVTKQTPATQRWVQQYNTASAEVRSR